MSFIAWIVVGLIAGIIANLLYPEPAAGGVIGAILLGIVGAVIGGWIMGITTKRDMTTGIDAPTIGISVLGALIALVVWNALF